MTSPLTDIAGSIGRVVVHITRERLGADRRTSDPAVVPPSARAVTPQWLTGVLCRDVPGAMVIDVEAGEGHNGTSARLPLRVVYNSVGQAAGLPTSLFTKATSTFTSRLLMGVTEIVEGEAIFYNRARPTLDLRSPRAFYAGYDPHTYRSLLLLEDLGPQGWTFPAPMTNTVTRRDAETMVEQLATYHGGLWDSPRLCAGGDLAGLRGATAWQEKLNPISYRKRTLVGLERARHVVPDEVYARRGGMHDAFMRALHLHDLAPQTLLHQDVHLGNWLRDPDGAMGLYDWQCVARGNWALDVSYALSVALPIEDRRAWEADLLRHYLDRLRAHGVAEPPSFDEAMLAYRRQPLHALTLALFSIGGTRFENKLQPQGYMMWAIERIARFVADMETFDVLR